MIVHGLFHVAAAQMWTFVTLLPLFVGDLIPLDDTYWECFLLLLQLVKQCTARVTSVSVSTFIMILVAQHNRLFKKCYPDATLTPKMHYMVHFSSQLLQYVAIYYEYVVHCIYFIMQCWSICRVLVYADGG